MIPNRFTTKFFAGLILAASLSLSGAAIAATGSYTLSKVTFRGNAQVPTDELEAALPYKAGDSIDKDGVQADTDAVAGVYRKHNVGASLGSRFTATGKKATLTYVLAEQAPVAPTVTHVGITADSVSVTGNTRITTANILAAANIKPGDTVTQDKLATAQKAISGLYKKANIGSTVTADWTTPSPQHIDLVFKIVEKPDQG